MNVPDYDSPICCRSGYAVGWKHRQHGRNTMDFLTICWMPLSIYGTVTQIHLSCWSEVVYLGEGPIIIEKQDLQDWGWKQTDEVIH